MHNRSVKLSRVIWGRLLPQNKRFNNW